MAITSEVKSVIEQYNIKRVSPQAAASQVKSGDYIVVPSGVGEPPALLTALSERRHELQNVAVSQILALRKYAYLDPATAAHIRHVSYFYGPATRAGGQAGWVDFVPSYFSEMPQLIERGLLPADVVFSMASPMDAHGYFSVSLGADYTLAAAAKARVVCWRSTQMCPLLMATAMCIYRRSPRW